MKIVGIGFFSLHRAIAAIRAQIRAKRNLVFESFFVAEHMVGGGVPSLYTTHYPALAREITGVLCTPDRIRSLPSRIARRRPSRSNRHGHFSVGRQRDVDRYCQVTARRSLF